MRRLPRATVSPGASRHPAPPRSCDATSCRRGGGTRCSGRRRRLETHRGIFMSQPGSDLSRRLRSRHIQLIAIGGTIGVGLFLGSARAQGRPAPRALPALYGSTLLAVRMFGELAFWFALIKVVTIVGLIVSGVVVIVFHVGDLGAGASFSNLWSHGGFLPYGVGGMLLTMQIVMFAYVGVELIGVTAGEAQDPKVVLPRATNGIILRILIFYIGALIVIMALVPWNELSPSVSPFVFVFEKLRVPAAAGL